MSAQPTNQQTNQQSNLIREEIDFLLKSDIPFLERYLASVKRRLEYLTQIVGPAHTVSVTLTPEQVQGLAAELQQRKDLALQCPQLSSLALMFVTRHLSECELTTYLKDLTHEALNGNGRPA